MFGKRFNFQLLTYYQYTVDTKLYFRIEFI